MTEVLYKYRSLEDFKKLVDILINKRLYASHYKDLNDPMEGQYYYNEGILDKVTRNKLSGEKGNLKICALSKVDDNELMWAHYANGHNGIAIGVKIDDVRYHYDVDNIIYDGILEVNNANYRDLTAKQILTHKLSVWNYEKEVRVFVNGDSFVNVEIVQIVIGSRTSQGDKSLIKSLVMKINPRIEIIER